MLSHSFTSVESKILPQFFKSTLAQQHEERAKLHQTETVSVDDDLIMYIYDSLKWIHTRVTNVNEPVIDKRQVMTGLNLCGISSFDFDEKAKFKAIVTGWHALFSTSPCEFELRGLWIEIGENKNSGHYSRIELKKRDVLGNILAKN